MPRTCQTARKSTGGCFYDPLDALLVDLSEAETTKLKTAKAPATHPTYEMVVAAITVT